MKVLYFSTQPLRECDGVTKKVYAQIEAIEKLGHSTRLVWLKDIGGSMHVYFNDETISENAYDGHMYEVVYNAIKDGKFDVIYFRYVASATPQMLVFLRKLKKLNIKILLEIPTFPYDGELSFSTTRELYRVLRERVCRRLLYLYVDNFVTTSEYDTIFGVSTIKVSNAISIMPPLRKEKPIKDTVKLVSVANIAFWHGYDRIIMGLRDYYNSSPKINVSIDIIGDGDKEIIKSLNELVNENGLKQYIRFIGPKSGFELDEAFKEADMAIGCLGCHRKKITEVKSLKNVEYAMRGLPFVYSEQNSDFDGQPYIFKVSSDDTPINIHKILKFLLNCKISAKQIHESVKEMTWENQMKVIFDKII